MNTSNKRLCSNCGTQPKRSADFCARCGSKLPAHESPVTMVTNPMAPSSGPRSKASRSNPGVTREALELELGYRGRARPRDDQVCCCCRLQSKCLICLCGTQESCGTAGYNCGWFMCLCGGGPESWWFAACLMSWFCNPCIWTQRFREGYNQAGLHFCWVALLAIVVIVAVLLVSKHIGDLELPSFR